MEVGENDCRIERERESPESENDGKFFLLIISFCDTLDLK